MSFVSRFMTVVWSRLGFRWHWLVVSISLKSRAMMMSARAS